MSCAKDRQQKRTVFARYTILHQWPCLQVLLAKRADIGPPALGGSTIELLAHAGVPHRSPNPPSVLMLEAAPAAPAQAEARSQGPAETHEA